jgi:uncharacterized membrane protein
MCKKILTYVSTKIKEVSAMNLPLPQTALHAATSLVYVVHVGCGTTGLAAGTVAAFAPKGERLHRAAGTVFFVSMLVMAVFAAWLAIAIQGQTPNLLGAVLTFYLVATGWLTVRRKQRTIGRAEKVALAASLFVCVALGGLSAAEAAGAIPGVKGQLLMATYMVTAIAAVAAMGDARVVLQGGIAGAARVARHLWRMLTALFLAFGSGFGNGLARLLPGPFHVPPLFLLPMLLPLGLLIFWMIRVTLTGWAKQARLASG